jgi:hypothetical protein
MEVLDVSIQQSASICGRVLNDFGASVYKESRFHNANPPATTGVTSLNLFQFAHFLAMFSASVNSFPLARSASASNLSFSGCMLMAECRMVVKCMIAATPKSVQQCLLGRPSNQRTHSPRSRGLRLGGRIGCRRSSKEAIGGLKALRAKHDLVILVVGSRPEVLVRSYRTG